MRARDLREDEKVAVLFAISVLKRARQLTRDRHAHLIAYGAAREMFLLWSRSHDPIQATDEALALEDQL